MMDEGLLILRLDCGSQIRLIPGHGRGEDHGWIGELYLASAKSSENHWTAGRTSEAFRT